MKKITFKGLLFVAFISSCFAINAQELVKQNSSVPDHRNCGLEQHEQELLKNPEYATSFYERQAVFQQKLSEIHQQKMNGTYQKKATLYVPVAVHFPDSNELDRVCLEAFAQTQIDVISNDYAALNADQSLWAAASGFYPGLAPGSVDVVFCIATKNHPAGGDPAVTDGNPLVTIGSDGSSFGAWPETDATYSGYMNFIIKDAGAGILGYSPLGGSISAGNAVVMSYSSYGTGAGCIGSGGTPNVIPGAPYNLGRTVTHELGHFYNLNHTFITDGGTSCVPADGDGIADTPKVAGSTYGNPANGSVAGCVGGEFSLTMDYMDYVNDASMYMFTPDQATVVDAYFASVSGDWVTNVLDCTGPTFSLNSGDLGNCGADSAVATVNFITANGFNEVTTFSVTGLPVGAIASFSPTTLNADGSTTLTVTGLNSVPDAVYPLVVTGTSASITKNVGISLNDGTTNCTVSATVPYLTSITRVTFGTIDNATSSPDGSGAENGGYSDLTGSQTTDVNIDSMYPLTVKIDADGNYRTQTKVWIDWNQNCTFDIPSEEYDLGNAAVTVALNFDIATTNSPMSITVPATAVLGNTIMRVATIYSSPTAPYDYPTSCGVNTDGEVEDYTINVLASLSVAENQFHTFSIFPNPSNGFFNLSVSTSDDTKIKLFDIRGRNVYSELHTNNSDVFNTTLDFSVLAPGVYLLDIESGSKRAVKKIVIQ
ncbi:MAG: hypothetical protein COA88_03495 [Kordia sp.]|nr:MAG: hypothetical protein COA88_03495 [Kordia sp.]